MHTCHLLEMFHNFETTKLCIILSVAVRKLISYILEYKHLLTLYFCY